MISIYEDDSKVAELTNEVIAKSGSKLLQIHRFAADETEHVDQLLEIFDPEHGALIADVGCGVGRLAELMKQQRPDLKFILINKSESQLEMCTSIIDWNKFVGVAEDLPLSADSVDAVMATYVIGHLDVQSFASECNRVLVENGKVYIYDIFKWHEHSPCGLKDLGYTEWTRDELVTVFDKNGFSLTGLDLTAFVPDKILELMPYKDVLKNTVSQAMVFEKL